MLSGGPVCRHSPVGRVLLNRLPAPHRLLVRQHLPCPAQPPSTPDPGPALWSPSLSPLTCWWCPSQSAPRSSPSADPACTKPSSRPDGPCTCWRTRSADTAGLPSRSPPSGGGDIGAGYNDDGDGNVIRMTFVCIICYSYKSTINTTVCETK